MSLSPQSGVMMGRVVNAESENPLPDAVLTIFWLDRDVDPTTLRPFNRERSKSVTTDAGGWYRLCGMPTDTWLSLQLQHMGRTGPEIRALVGDTLGIVVRHLSFDAPSARSALDSAASTATMDSVAAVLLSGTATLSGIVRGTGDLPLASADLRVRGARTTGRTDALGRYSISALPAGTQMLEVRHLGYLAAEIPVELRSGVTVTRNVRLQRIVNLDSIRVVATLQRYTQFSTARNFSPFGIFLGPERPELLRAAHTSEVIQLIPGFRVIRVGHEAIVLGNRGPLSCKANVVVNGAEDYSINDISPLQIGAIAAYRQGQMGPQEFDRGCGAILIWTKR